MLPTILFICLRFIKIDADFPLDVSSLGMIYTDEGWYTNGAIEKVKTGSWYKPGEQNLILNIPIIYLLQTVTFSTLGPSITSARLTIIFCFIIMLLAMFEFVRRKSNITSACVCVFLISVNYLLFAYSRFAILEIPMMCFISLSFLCAVINKKRFLILSILFMFIAILTKQIAVFSIPALMFLYYNRFKWCSIFAVIPLVLYLFYISIMGGIFSEFSDYSKFQTGRIALGTIFTNFMSAINNSIAFVPFIAAGILFFMPIRSLKKDKFLLFSIVWTACCFLFFPMTNYQPSRYFVMLIIPMCLSFSILISNKKRIIAATIIFTLLTNGLGISYYLIKSKYTFKDMCHSISAIVGDKTLYGTMANTISLETGIKSKTKINDLKDMGYFVTLGSKEEIRNILMNYQVTTIGKCNVYNRKVDLFRINRR
jgi:hypothetical protein